MPDLLTHVLVVYAAATVISWQTRRFDRRMVPVAMLGAGIPDLSKLHYVVSNETVRTTIGQPFVWNALHRIGPTVVISGLVALWFPQRLRLRIGGSLFAGASSHFLLDLGVKRASGVAPPYLYPLTWWHPPSLNLYQSSNVWPTAIALVTAVVVYSVDQRIQSRD